MVSHSLQERSVYWKFRYGWRCAGDALCSGLCSIEVVLQISRMGSWIQFSDCHYQADHLRDGARLPRQTCCD